MKNWLTIGGLFIMIAVTTFAEDTPKTSGENNSTDLAKQTQNPIADLISLPFQWNVGFDTGPENNTSSVLNIQPVIPFNPNEDWTADSGDQWTIAVGGGIGKIVKIGKLPLNIQTQVFLMSNHPRADLNGRLVSSFSFYSQNKNVLNV